MIEQVDLNKDGSGKLKFTLNLSKSKTKLASILKMKTINGHAVPTEAEIRKKIADMEKTIAGTKGISSVKTTLDMDNYIMTLSCDFANVTAMNAVLKNIKLKEKADNTMSEELYAYDSKTSVFSRINKFALKQAYAQMGAADKEIFANANYTAIYKFETEVISVSNKNAKVSPNKKAVMIQSDVLSIINAKNSIENKINLQK
jgi:hypothetical protein